MTLLVNQFLRMIRRQTRIAARAPMLSLSVCPSWTSSQLAPQKPSRQRHWYRSFGSMLMHVAPLRQGRSRHSFRSMHPLPSGDMILPSPHLVGHVPMGKGWRVSVISVSGVQCVWTVQFLLVMLLLRVINE